MPIDTNFEATLKYYQIWILNTSIKYRRPNGLFVNSSMIDN